jgi:predicted amidohydrolase
MPARAIENTVYLAVANRAGRETRGQDQLVFKGESAIYDVNGLALRSADRTEDNVLTATIYPERARNKSFNPFNHILNDRKPQHYSPLTE